LSRENVEDKLNLEFDEGAKWTKRG